MCPSAPRGSSLWQPPAPSRRALSQTKGFISLPLSARHCVIKPGTDQILPDPRNKGNRQRGRGAAGLWCHYKQRCSWEVSHAGTYERKWLYAHASQCGSESELADSVIEQRRHLQASVRSNILTEERSIWSQPNTLRWIIKAQGDLSCRVKLSIPCDHGVIMSRISGSTTCQPVVLH